MIPYISTPGAVSREDKKLEPFWCLFETSCTTPDCYIPYFTKGAANFKSHDCISGLDKY